MDKIQYPFNENQATMIKLAILRKMNLTENNATLCIYIYIGLFVSQHIVQCSIITTSYQAWRNNHVTRKNRSLTMNKQIHEYSKHWYTK